MSLLKIIETPIHIKYKQAISCSLGKLTCYSLYIGDIKIPNPLYNLRRVIRMKDNLLQIENSSLSLIKLMRIFFYLQHPSTPQKRKDDNLEITSLMELIHSDVPLEFFQ
jgi:hypothetical protein